MLADDLLSHFVLGSTYHVNCFGFVTVSTFFPFNLNMRFSDCLSGSFYLSEIEKAS